MSDIHELQNRLNIAGERLRRAIAAMAPKHKGGEWEEYRAANQEVLRLERQLAAVKSEEYAEPCGFPLKWDAGATALHIFGNSEQNGEQCRFPEDYRVFFTDNAMSSKEAFTILFTMPFSASYW